MVALESLSKKGILPKNDLTRRRFERLVVRGWAGRDHHGHNYWDCECDCGNFLITRSQFLIDNFTKSCGCLMRENRIKHGLSRDETYRIWAKMIERCSNPNSSKWEYYGGRGITVCEEWRSFESFYKSMGKRPTVKHSIDRIDNNLGYFPENCKWSTKIEQANNKQITIFLTFRNEKKALSIFAREFDLTPNLVRKRISRGWSAERALTTPVNINYRSRQKAA